MNYTGRDISNKSAVKCTGRDISNKSAVKCTDRDISNKSAVKCTGRDISNKSTVKCTGRDISNKSAVKCTDHDISNKSAVKCTGRDISNKSTVKCTGRDISNKSAVKCTDHDISNKSAVKCTGRDISNKSAVKFLSSGADVICTATYQASVEGFMKFLGLSSEQAVQLLMSGVYLAKEAALEFQQTCRDPVAGSVGPYGAFLHDGSEYTGAYEETMSVQDFKAWHRQQIQCLVSAGVDLIAMETIPSQKEAEALVELLREFPNSKAWLSYSCKDEQCISHGEKFAEAVKVASRSEQLLAIGLNCCPPTLVSPLLASANKNKAPGLGWVVYPNGGGEWDQSTGLSVPFTLRGSSAPAFGGVGESLPFLLKASTKCPSQASVVFDGTVVFPAVRDACPAASRDLLMNFMPKVFTV
ncbi:Homocysteine S-methyltransferase 1 [Acipenser ruthenus]|uniref:Homocysteine S-methyltransferase 1 n=1 Tax=Acipenser ruthenus TaxID=7906 RepID=A0A444UYW9_ACIRT|nr:Homocysteine S-methyltransferase 1 [Acipenser ruthenus]